MSDGVRTYRYVVKSGDTLYAISKLHGLTVAQIAEMNGLEPPYTIIPDQILVVTPSRVLWQENIAAEDRSDRSDLIARNRSTQTSRPITSQQEPASKSTLTIAQTAPRKTERTSEKAPVLAQVSRGKNPVITTVSTGETSRPPTSTASQPMESSESVGEAQTDAQSLDSLPKGWEWPVNTRPSKPKGSDDGLTYFLNRGTNVVAAASGRVSYAGVALSDYRYMVLVKTPDNYVIQYDFNSELTVKENDIVSKGQPLVRISEKGVPKSEDEGLYRRLYFAIWHKAVPQDPNKLMGL